MSRWRAPALVTLGLTATCALYSFPLLLSPGSHQVGRGDTELVAWFVGAEAGAVAHGNNPFVLGMGNVPDGVNAMWNGGLLLLAVVAAPLVQLVGAMTVVSLVYALAPLANGAAAYLALGLMTPRPLPRFVGALLFAYCPFVLGQFHGHAHLVAVPAVPLLLYLWGRLLRNPERWRVVGPLLGLTASAQLLFAEEVLVIAALTALVLTASLLLVGRRLSRVGLRRVAAGTGVAACVFVGVCAVPLSVQLVGPDPVRGPVQTLDYYKSDVLGPVTAPRSLVVSTAGTRAAASRFRGGEAENTAYVGVPALVLLVVLLGRRRRDPALVAVVLSTVAMLLLSLGGRIVVGGRQTGVPGPFALLQALPGFESLLPARLSLGADALMAAAVTCALADVLEQWRRPLAARTALRAALVAAVLLSLVPRPATDVFRTPGSPHFFGHESDALVRRGETALVVPVPGPQSVDAMRWQRAAGYRFAMVGGYFVIRGSNGRARFGSVPRPTSSLLGFVTRTGEVPAIRSVERAAFRSDTAYWGCSQVVLGPTAHEEPLVRVLTALVGRPPRHVGGVYVWSLLPQGAS